MDYIIDEKYLKTSIKIFKNENININDYDLSNTEILNIIGIYYSKINECIKMKEYFLRGYKQSNLNCVYNLGLFYLNNDNIDLAKKYFLIYFQFRYNLNFDTKSNDYTLLLIQILIQKNLDPNTLDLDDINILNILGIYYKSIKNNITMSCFYYVKEIEKNFNIKFEENLNPQLIIKIFTDTQINIDNYDLNDKEILDIITLYFENINKNTLMIKKIYNIGIMNGYYEYYYKLGLFYKSKKKNKIQILILITNQSNLKKCLLKFLIKKI